MSLLGGMAFGESQNLVEEVKKINRRLDRIQDQLTNIEIYVRPRRETKKDGDKNGGDN